MPADRIKKLIIVPSGIEIITLHFIISNNEVLIIVPSGIEITHNALY